MKNEQREIDNLHPAVATIGIRNRMTDVWLADDKGPFGFTHPSEAWNWLKANLSPDRTGVYSVDRFYGNEYREAMEMMMKQRTIIDQINEKTNPTVKGQTMINGKLEYVSIPVAHVLFDEDVAATTKELTPISKAPKMRVEIGETYTVGANSYAVSMLLFGAAAAWSFVIHAPWIGAAILIGVVCQVITTEFPKLPKIGDDDK